MILPYHLDERNGEFEVCLYEKDYLEDELPLTWKYFGEHREALERRESGKMRGRDDWYAFIYPKSHDRFPLPKIIGAEIASEATFMLDADGSWYFKTAYGIQLLSDYRERTGLVTGLLNSKTLDFYLKHITSIKSGGYYKYMAQYLEKLPIKWDNDSLTSKITNMVLDIVSRIDIENKIGRFPSAYLGDFEGELHTISYTWQTRRKPVEANIQQLSDGKFAVEAGRTDSIRHPVMDSEVKARYVHEAVNGMDVKKGGETTITIPRTDSGCEELLEALESDREKAAEVSVEELEEQIDEAVYELYGLDEDDIEVIERFLERF